MSVVIYVVLGSACTELQTHREEARNAAAQARLPVYGAVVVQATSQHVYRCYDDQVDAHAEVRESQMAHEETRNGQFGAAA